MYSKTCLIGHLCNAFPCVVWYWFPCPFDHFRCVLHCVIQHPVYSNIQLLSQCMSYKTGFTVLWSHVTNKILTSYCMLFYKLQNVIITIIQTNTCIVIPGCQLTWNFDNSKADLYTHCLPNEHLLLSAVFPLIN